MAEFRCLGNYRKTKKSTVLAAVKESGAAVEWKESPDSRMDSYMHRGEFGSIWSGVNDLSEFWSAIKRLEEKAEAN